MMKHLPYEIEGPARRPSTFRAYARAVTAVISLVIIVLITSGVAGYFSRKC